MADTTQLEVAEKLEEFLRESFDIAPDDAGFSREVDLWEEGYVDSKGVVEVIAFLEESFGVRLPDEVLFAPEFTRVNGIAQLVAGLPAELQSGPQSGQG